MLQHRFRAPAPISQLSPFNREAPAGPSRAGAPGNLPSALETLAGSHHGPRMRRLFLFLLVGLTRLPGTQVALEWDDNSVNETGFRLERRSGNSAWAPIASLPANSVRHRDTDLPRRGEFSYRVLSANLAGDSAPSNVLEIGSHLYLQESAAGTVAVARQYSGRVVVLASFPGRPGRILILETKADAAGRFSGSVAETVATAAAAPEIFAVSGTFASGRLAATVKGAGIDLTVSSAPAVTAGTAERFSGYHRAPMLGQGAGVLHAVAFPDGRCWSVATDRSGLLLAQSWSTLSGTGRANLAAANGETVALAVDPETALFSGQIGGPAGTRATYAGLFDGEPSSSRLVNLSVRAAAGTGDQVLIAGFAVSAGAAKAVLVRGIGPTLSSFGVGGVLADPVLSLFEARGQFATNDDWRGATAIAATAAAVGAFALPGNSRDAAVLSDLAPGTYTAQIAGKGTAAGTALLELYEAPGNSSARLVNLSARTRVDAPLIVGFAVQGNTPRRLLIRAVGPALAPFGIPDFLPDPTLEIFAGSTSLFRNDDWGGDPIVVAANAASGAFPLAAGSRDAAILVTLASGTYSAVVSDRGTGRGVALVEVYEVP